MKLRFIMFSLAAILVAISCGKTSEEDKPVVQPDIQIPASSQAIFSSGISFPEYSGTSAQTASLSFTATASWSTDVSDTKASSWLSVQPSSGGAGTVNMTVSVQPNAGETARSGKVTIKCGTVSKSFSVTQAGNPPAVIAVESVTLNKETLELEKGNTFQLVATVLPANATDKTLSWSSTDSQIVSVEHGLIKAVSEGEATISVKAGECTAKCVVTVPKHEIPVTSVSLDKSEAEIEVGKTLQLTATVLPEDATDKTLSWSSSDSQIASVENGLITAISVGEATISVKAGEQEASCQVKVLAECLSLRYKTITGALIDLSNYHNFVSHYYDSESGYNVITFRPSNPDRPSIPSSWFYLNEDVTDVIIPEGIVEIQNRSFQQCGNLSSVSLPETLRVIGECAFLTCEELTSINIPRYVETIGANAFCACRSLPGVVLPETLTVISPSCFAGCSSIRSITIPLKVTSIQGHAFNNCTELTSVVIPNGVTEIADYAFMGCPNLTTILLPNKLRRIGLGAFQHSGLVSVDVPDSVTEIGMSAFSECKKLESAHLPEGLTEIPSRQFNRCTSLKSINIPKTVTSIGDYSFYLCERLADLSLPEGLAFIGKYAFNCCSNICWSDFGEHVDIIIPSTVSTIGEYAFDIPAHFILLPQTPPLLETGAFGWVTPSPEFYVHSESLEAYKSADSWAPYKDHLQAIPE